MIKIALQESRESPDFVCFVSKNVTEIGPWLALVLKKYANCF